MSGGVKINRGPSKPRPRDYHYPVPGPKPPLPASEPCEVCGDMQPLRADANYGVRVCWTCECAIWHERQPTKLTMLYKLRRWLSKQ